MCLNGSKDKFNPIRETLYPVAQCCGYLLVVTKCSYFPVAVFAESLEARCQVENEDVVGAAPTGDAPTTSEWSTILFPTQVRLILETLRYV